MLTLYIVFITKWHQSVNILHSVLSTLCVMTLQSVAHHVIDAKGVVILILCEGARKCFKKDVKI